MFKAPEGKEEQVGAADKQKKPKPYLQEQREGGGPFVYENGPAFDRIQQITSADRR